MNISEKKWSANINHQKEERLDSNSKSVMNINELYLKTVFCCMACDGDIADEEVALIKKHCETSDLYDGIDVETTINGWIKQINEEGTGFLQKYLKELSNEVPKLSDEQQLQIVRLAVEMIEADNIIQYSEVKFFKKIRSRLFLSDEAITAEHPDKEDWLLPDIIVSDDVDWDSIVFDEIKLNL